MVSTRLLMRQALDWQAGTSDQLACLLSRTPHNDVPPKSPPSVTPSSY